MALTMGVMSASSEDRTQDRGAAGDLELVDVQPPDAGDDRPAVEESDEDASEDSSTEDSVTEDSEFTYENCAAAGDDGAAPINEGERGFGPHLDADNDGIGCEHWGTPSEASDGSEAPDDDAYENCAAARADGAAPINEGERGFGPHLDADNDGIGCEQ